MAKCRELCGTAIILLGYWQKKTMKILHFLGALLIIIWLVLWLALKVTFAAVHALVVIGVILIIIAFVAGRSSSS